MSLDVYDLCTPELQAKLQPARDKFKELEDKKAEEMIQVMHTEELILLHFVIFCTLKLVWSEFLM